MRNPRRIVLSIVVGLMVVSGCEGLFGTVADDHQDPANGIGTSPLAVDAAPDAVTPSK